MPDSVPLDCESVIRKHYTDIFRFAMSLTGIEAESVDLTQQVFFKYATRGSTIRDKSKIKSWLFRTVKNEFLDQARRRKRFPHVEVSTAESELPRVEECCENAVDSRLALEAMQKLDEKFRLPLSLYYLESLSYAEIADILEIPKGTVMSRLSRGKDHLAKILGVRKESQ